MEQEPEAEGEPPPQDSETSGDQHIRTQLKPPAAIPGYGKAYLPGGDFFESRCSAEVVPQVTDVLDANSPSAAAKLPSRPLLKLLLQGIPNAGQSFSAPDVLKLHVCPKEGHAMDKVRPPRGHKHKQRSQGNDPKERP
jgi:hypothetical protein